MSGPTITLHVGDLCSCMGPASLGEFVATRIEDILSEHPASNQLRRERFGDWLKALPPHTLADLFEALEGPSKVEAPPPARKPRAPNAGTAKPRATRKAPEPALESGKRGELLGMYELQTIVGATAEEIRKALKLTAGQAKGMLKRAKDSGQITYDGSHYHLGTKSNGAAAHTEAAL